MTKKKVAILGGGCASMAAAYYLSNTKELQNALDVTVYQMGWRLGGKGASGRNHSVCDRIEEHGLHVWGGFYYNAFRMMRQCYEALARPNDCPLQHWYDAFKKHNFIAWEEQIDGHWSTWPVRPELDENEIPGDGPPNESVLECLERLIGMIGDALKNWPHEDIRRSATEADIAHPHVQLLLDSAVTINTLGGTFDGSPLSAIRSAQLIAHSMNQPSEAFVGQALRAVELTSIKAILSAIRAWLREVHEGLLENDTLLRRLFIVAELGLTIGMGIVNDVIPRGYMSIDGEDFQNWLLRNNACEKAVESAAIRGFYDYFFAYENGDPDRPRMSAGIALHHLVRLVGSYKGSLFWKMQSGMGDAVFAPLYELCVRNGVNFEFFHRVDDLVPSATGDSIDKIIIKRQVRLKNSPYHPLVYPKKIPSWPSEPLYDQINDQDVAKLKQNGVDLEDPWSDWDDPEVVELKAGAHFDAVVLGISIGAFPYVCPSILAQNKIWRTMVSKLPTIQTEAMQLWFTEPVEKLGWQGGNATGSAFVAPHQSWSDMTPVIGLAENWPSKKPLSVIYFCGPMLTASMPTGKDPSFGQRQRNVALGDSQNWMTKNLADLYGAVGRDTAFKWDLLFDLNKSSGAKRFDAQYVRANYTPSERYVLDLPGTAQYRLEADTSGYKNLALAGDWIFTGLGGAVESAVIAGMLAARGLIGEGNMSDQVVDETANPWRVPRSLDQIL